MPTYVIYARKSSESEDRQVLSIDSQIQELKTLALRQGIHVGEILTEARSAKEPGRPVFGELMRRVRRGSVTGLLCWKMDRLARNHLDHGQVLQALADRKLESVITSDRTYTPDGNDRFLGNFELGMATKYIDDLRANVKRGNRARFQRGWPNYRPPAGYLEDRATKTIAKDPVRFDLVRRAWDLLLSGSMRPSQILRILNGEWGYRSRLTKARSGGPMSLSGLYGLFQNPFYKGILQLVNGETYVGAYDRMVTEEEFARGQELLGRPSRARPIHHEFAFSGLLRCASCGRALVAEQHVKPSGKRYVYYRCHRRRAGETCSEPSIPEGKLNEQFASGLLRMRLGPEAATWIHDNITRSLQGEISQLRSAQDSLDRAVQQASREEETLLTLRLRGSIDDITYDRRRAEILDRKAHLQLRLERPSQSPEDLLERVDAALLFAQRAHEVFLEGTPVQQRQILEAVGSNFRATGGKALYEAKKPFSLFERTAASSLWWTIAEDVRKWLLSGEDLWIPDLQHPPVEETLGRLRHLVGGRGYVVL